MIEYWRKKLKTGPLREVYRTVRAVKRRLLGESLVGVLAEVVDGREDVAEVGALRERLYAVRRP